MRKPLTLVMAAFVLSGCMMSGPMALIPITSQYLLWNDGDRETSENPHAISVDELLSAARSDDFEVQEQLKIDIAYQEHFLTETELDLFRKAKAKEIEVICGPYENGDPLTAAALALKSCRTIAQQLEQLEIKISIRFQPNAVKGFATIKVMPGLETEDA
ncbi:MAG: hypothetical protein R3261_08045 [Alphaproteobacteria bacterium]|nr:hypothetical protein [Alphaproteobacteria bacterium]